MRGALTAALLAGATALAGCERPFEPFAENENGPFSMVGYLDLRADTQWVRVMPIRQNLFAEPDPIDAVVTLERVGGGRTVTLRDSLFRFEDERLGGVAYAHVFWTTERLEPKARYRLAAARSDGAASTALVETPSDLEFSFRNLEGGQDIGWVEVKADRMLFIETLHTTRSTSGEPGGVVPKRQRGASPTSSPGIHFASIEATPPVMQSQVDVRRTELYVATASIDWPTHGGPALVTPDLATLPSNVENGLGYVGTAATWTIPFDYCAPLAPRNDGVQACTILSSSSAASLSGRVTRQPCGRPHALGEVRLTERFAGGGAIVRRWKAGWDGSYRFEGIEPGSELSLQVGSAPNVPVVAAVTVPLPSLAPGQRHAVQDLSVSVTQGC